MRTTAGSRSFERGQEYAAHGRVKKLRTTDSTAQATVHGSHPYQVRLWVEGGEAAFSCSCPVGSEGHFCKHAVAVALLVTDPQTAQGHPDAAPEVDVRAYLASLDHGDLIELVLTLAATSDLAANHLYLDAARKGSQPPAVEVFIDAIDQAFATDGFVSYQETYAYVDRIRATIDTLGYLLEDGQAAMVVRLAEHALEQAEGAIESIDDSDGHLGEIATVLQDLHLKACRKARPDPSQLAARLFDWELHGGDLDVFSGAAQTYASVLGEQGLAAYHTLAEAAWTSLPPLSPGAEGSYQTTRFRITHMMESLAEVDGDVDAVVAVLARDLSSPYQFVRIAKRLSATGRFTDALTWAQRGLECFGTDADDRLVEVAADGYHRAGLSGRAVDLTWQVFDSHPSPTTYRRLHAQATRAGSWEVWRPQALTRLRQEVAGRIQTDRAQERSRGARPHWMADIDGSDLVEVFLFEGDSEQAWAEPRPKGARSSCGRTLLGGVKSITPKTPSPSSKIRYNG
ncbi:MAG: SWIM zinc finger family protein [Sulfobacillus sp.]